MIDRTLSLSLSLALTRSRCRSCSAVSVVRSSSLDYAGRQMFGPIG